MTAKTAKPASSPQTEPKLGRPLADDTPASGHIHLRVTMERKNRYVRAARKLKMKLSEWMTASLDKESGE